MRSVPSTHVDDATLQIRRRRADDEVQRRLRVDGDQLVADQRLTRAESLSTAFDGFVVVVTDAVAV